MVRLANKPCTPCAEGTKRFSPREIEQALSQISGWHVVDRHHLEKDYVFKDFLSGLAFVNQIAVIAEAQQHHPDISLRWGKVGVVIFTHSIDGLQEGDFILADKIDLVFEQSVAP